MRKRPLLILALAVGCDIVPSQIFSTEDLWQKANPPILPEQHQRSRANNTVLVGVLDSGVDYHHPFIRNHIDSFALETPEHGRIRGIGWDVLGKDSFPYHSVLDPSDGEEYPMLTASPGHGTHVAQLATLNNKGIRLFPVRVLPVVKVETDPCDALLGNVRDCQLSYVSRAFEAMSAGIQKCHEHGCQIINMSLGIRITSLEVKDDPKIAALRADFDRNIQTQWKDILFVVAAGNEGVKLTEGIDSVPASLDAPNILSIGALDNAKTISYYSNYDRYVDVYVKGTQVRSALPGNSIGKMDGTSMATPLAAHLASELKLLDPTLSPEEIRAIIINTADTKLLPVSINPEDPQNILPPRKILVMNAKFAKMALKTALKKPHVRPFIVNIQFPHGKAPYMEPVD